MRYIAFVSTFLFSTFVNADNLFDYTDKLLDRSLQRVKDTWTQGDHDLYIPFYSYHSRSKYSQKQLDSFTEDALGIGYGRSRYDESSNLDHLYGMAFQDSNGKPQYIVGYGYQWVMGNSKGLHTGLGYTVFLTARSDYSNYIPIPGILPVASINYNKVSINTAYIPSYKDQGNVLFFWSKFRF
jgi:lipid IVA palmitoyltransferase